MIILKPSGVHGRGPAMSVRTYAPIKGNSQTGFKPEPLVDMDEMARNRERGVVQHVEEQRPDGSVKRYRYWTEADEVFSPMRHNIERTGYAYAGESDTHLFMARWTLKDSPGAKVDEFRRKVQGKDNDRWLVPPEKMTASELTLARTGENEVTMLLQRSFVSNTKVDAEGRPLRRDETLTAVVEVEAFDKSGPVNPTGYEPPKVDPWAAGQERRMREALKPPPRFVIPKEPPPRPKEPPTPGYDHKLIDRGYYKEWVEVWVGKPPCVPKNEGLGGPYGTVGLYRFIGCPTDAQGRRVEQIEVPIAGPKYGEARKHGYKPYNELMSQGHQVVQP